MNIIADTHTHTSASAHAYSSIAENAKYANEIGLNYIALTNHGPALPDAPHIWHFNNIKSIPNNLCGVNILRGIEANIVNSNGDIDIEDSLAFDLEWVIASFHTPVCSPMSFEEHTTAFLGVAKNKNVDVIGHSGQGSYHHDYEKVIKSYKENDKIVEINNHSFDVRAGSKKNCREIALLCKKHCVRIVVSSDAHFYTEIGQFQHSLAMLNDINFPEELIINANINTFEEYIKYRR